MSSYTWLQFTSSKIIYLDKTGNAIQDNLIRRIGQKQESVEGQLRNCYYAGIVVGKGDPWAKKKWKDIQSSEIEDRLKSGSMFLNQETRSTSTFVVPFLSFIEKGVELSTIMDNLKPSNRRGMISKAEKEDAAGAMQVGILSDIDFEREDSRERVDLVKIPVKIPFDPIVVKAEPKLSIRNDLIQIGLLDDRATSDHTIFTEFVSAGIVRNAIFLSKDSDRFEIWLPGPQLEITKRGFEFVDLDLQNIVPRFKEHLAKQSEFKIYIVHFSNTEESGANGIFDTKPNLICDATGRVVSSVTPNIFYFQTSIAGISSFKASVTIKGQIGDQSLRSLIGERVLVKPPSTNW